MQCLSLSWEWCTGCKKAAVQSVYQSTADDTDAVSCVCTPMTGKIKDISFNVQRSVSVGQHFQCIDPFMPVGVEDVRHHTNHLTSLSFIMTSHWWLSSSYPLCPYFGFLFFSYECSALLLWRHFHCVSLILARELRNYIFTFCCAFFASHPFCLVIFRSRLVTHTVQCAFKFGIFTLCAMKNDSFRKTASCMSASTWFNSTVEVNMMITEKNHKQSGIDVGTN